MKISSKKEMGCGDSNSHSHMGFELKTLTQGPKNEKSKIRDRVRDISAVQPLWRQKSAAAGDGEEAWLTATTRGGVELLRESRDREREPRVRVRESPTRLRGSSDLTGTRVGDWEWRHDGGTLAGSGLHGRLGDSSHARVCECEVNLSV
jgi:hypothetical protein